MQASTQDSVFRHYPVSNAKKPSSDITKHYINKFQYYIAPEDTTESLAERRSKTPKHEELNAQGMLKTFLWMAMAIGLSLLIGNFC